MNERPDAHGSGDAAPRLHRCARCQQWKPESEFHHTRDGEFTYCRECRNAYDRQYYAQRGGPARRARNKARIDAARAWMNELKVDLSCIDCGERFPAFVMHWDHLPGFEKAGDISTMVGHRKRQAILEELRKCELVCANCHVVRTVNRATGSHRT